MKRKDSNLIPGLVMPALTLFGLSMVVTATAHADVFELVTGVAPGTSPGVPRPVAPSFDPGAAVPPIFRDGQRVGGTPSATPTGYLGTGMPLVDTNEFGALSFMYRRGLAPGPQPLPVMAVDYLGGPRLDLDGDLNNGSRSLTPTAQTAVAIPGTPSFVDLSFGIGSVALNNFDATSSNAGFQGFGPEIAVTVNTLAGTQPDGTTGAAINPTVDTRSGTVTPTGNPQVGRIENLGYELWQDSISSGSSSASTLGTLQYLGGLDGFVVEKDAQGQFPTLAGQLGSTAWPASAVPGATVNTTSAFPFDTATIANGIAGDDFSSANNGGLALTDFADLGAYLDAVVIPALSPNAERFVYLESAGFGVNNSFDPTFGDTIGYDVVLVAQFIPEPSTALLVLVGLTGGLMRRRHG